MKIQKGASGSFTRSKISPSVSVVIPAYNEEKFLPLTLESLKKQDYRGDFEILVVDNGSTDTTARIAHNLGVKVVYEPRKGVHFARQAGFEAASGHLIASTDADNILPANWLTQLACELKSSPNCVAVGGWFKLESGPKSSKFLINTFSAHGIALYKFLTGKQVLIGQNFIVRKDAFKKTDGFCNLTPMDEDLQFAQRLAKVGKIKLVLKKDFKIVTSPRRWRHNFFQDVLPYVINPITYALFNRIVIKNFKDVRVEKPVHPIFRIIPYLVGFAVFFGLFALVPASPVHAKILPASRHLRAKIGPFTKNVSSRLDYTFDSNRHKLYVKYKHTKFLRR